MSHTEKMKNAARISDLELYELVVAMYPKKFAARNSVRLVRHPVRGGRR